MHSQRLVDIGHKNVWGYDNHSLVISVYYYLWILLWIVKHSYIRGCELWDIKSGTGKQTIKRGGAAFWAETALDTNSTSYLAAALTPQQSIFILPSKPIAPSTNSFLNHTSKNKQCPDYVESGLHLLKQPIKILLKGLKYFPFFAGSGLLPC